MAQPTEVYVDPAINADTGTGTIGDPYGDLQFALNSKVRDATNGDRFNIKAGTAEVLAAILSLTTYGTPTAAAPLIFQGYTAAAGDGGIGGISGNGSVGVISSSANGIYFIDMHLHNTGGANIVSLTGDSRLYNCEIANCTVNGASISGGTLVANCYFHDVNVGVNCLSRNMVVGCFFKNGAIRNFARAIVTNTNVAIYFNVISLSGSSDGIRVVGAGSHLFNNSIWSNGGTGKGMSVEVANTVIVGNIVEGFSGTGGIGIENLSANDPLAIYGLNAAFNNATNYSVNDIILNLGDNETLTASAFRDAANDDFRLKNPPGGSVRGGGMWSPFKAAALTTQFLDKGAVQQIQGGFVRVHPGMSGGMRG